MLRLNLITLLFGYGSVDPCYGYLTHSSAVKKYGHLNFLAARKEEDVKQEQFVVGPVCEGVVPEEDCPRSSSNCNDSCNAEKENCERDKEQKKEKCKQICDNVKHNCEHEERSCRDRENRCKDDERRCKDGCGGRRARDRPGCRRDCNRNCNMNCNKNCGNRERDCKRSEDSCKNSAGECLRAGCKTECAANAAKDAVKGVLCRQKARKCQWTTEIAESGFGAFGGLAARLNQKPATADTYKSLFPEPNGGQANYTKNDVLKSYVRFQLALVQSGYDHGEGELGRESQETPGRLLPPGFKYCDVESETSCKNDTNTNEEAFKQIKRWSYSTPATDTSGSHDTQGTAFTYEDPKQIIVTMNWRGSERPESTFKDEKPAEKSVQLKSFIADWFGTDFQFEGVGDEICGSSPSDTRIHKGFQSAYRKFKNDYAAATGDKDGNWVDYIRGLITKEKKRADESGKQFKFFISGHSLGGALTVMSTYDTWCNQLFHTELGYADDEKAFLSGPFSVSFGEAYPWWGVQSAKHYSETVPITNRIRVNTCGQKGENVFGGDAVGGVTNFYPNESGGWRHTTDGDFQCAWVSKTGASSCVGFVNSLSCHMLDRYLEGMTNACPTDDEGPEVQCTLPERTDMRGFCKPGQYLKPKIMTEPEAEETEKKIKGSWKLGMNKAGEAIDQITKALDNKKNFE